MEGRLALRLPGELLAGLEKVAKRENPEGDLPISIFVRRAIKEYVDKRLGKKGKGR